MTSTRRWRPSRARSATPPGRATRSPSSSRRVPPQVTLNAVPTPSNNTTPSFSGTASESEPVTVKIYKGSKAEGTVVASVVAEVSSRNWSSGALAKALGSGEYTAQAGEPSSIGNNEGKSEARTFVVNTEPPKVSLVAVPSPSNDTSPAFSGTASESLPVTVKVYSGSKVEGSPVATAEANVSTGKWGPVSSSTLLTSGTYTAVAEESSSIGNGVGKSETRTFVINTSPPEVTLNSVTSPSNNTKPSFSGTASESLPVTVKIYKGPKAEGSPVATAEGPVSGKKWGPVSSTTPLSSSRPTRRLRKRPARSGTRRAKAKRGRSWSTPKHRKCPWTPCPRPQTTRARRSAAQRANCRR